MTTWRPEFNPDHLYFVTTKAVDYAHLFRRDLMKRLLVDALDCLRLRERLTLYAFVIMPNHIHLVIQCPVAYPVRDLVRDYKKHTADRIIRHYQGENNQQALQFLAAKAPPEQKYTVWEAGYQAKEVFSPDFLKQKMEYIHNNPCQPHWCLVAEPEAYLWSSARFYLTGKPVIIPVKDARALMV
jgi:putative transposase